MSLKIIRWVEFYIGDALCAIFGVFVRGRKLPKNIERILVVRTWSLGESLLALPMVKAYRDEFPKAKITVLVTHSSRAVFQGQRFVDEIIDFNLITLLNLLFRKLDLAIDTMPYFRHSALISRVTSRYVIGLDIFKHRSKLYDQVRTRINLGALNRMLNAKPGLVYANFINYSDNDKEVFYNNPAFISGFDFT